MIGEVDLIGSTLDTMAKSIEWKTLSGHWEGQDFTMYEEAVWNVSLDLSFTSKGKIKGSGTLTSTSDEDYTRDVILEGCGDIHPTTAKPRALIKMYDDSAVWLLALDLDVGAGTCTGQGYLTEDIEASFEDLVSAANRDNGLEVDTKKYKSDRAIEWVDPGRFELRRANDT